MTAPVDLDKQFESIAATGYTGWVAWVDDGGPEWSPVFESRPHNPKLAQVVGSLVRPEEEAVRKRSNQTMDWKQIYGDPALMAKVQLVAVFAFYGHYTQQPLMVIQRNAPGCWFIQYKKRGLQMPHQGDGGLQRTAVMAYYLGYWESQAKVPHVTMIEATAKGRGTLTTKHPCWPKPHGLGLNLAMCGLTAEQVPPCPYSPVGGLEPLVLSGG